MRDERRSALNSWTEWFVVLQLPLLVVGLVFLASRLEGLEQRLASLEREVARTVPKLSAVEKLVNEAVRTLEDRLAATQELFESGRACRVNDSIVDLGLGVRKINARLVELEEALEQRAPEGT